MGDILPEETLLHVFSYCNEKELCAVSRVKHSWCALASDDTLWAPYLHKMFLSNKYEAGKCKEAYQNLHETWKDYLPCYARVRAFWNNIEAWLAVHSPLVLNGLKEGADKAGVQEFLNTLQKLGVDYELPQDFLCSLRIHDGQPHTHPNISGLFGGCEVYDYRINIPLLPISLISDYTILLFQQSHRLPKWLANCMPIGGSLHQYSVYFIAIKDFVYGKEFKRGTIITHTRSFQWPVFVASSYSEWLERYAADLLRGRYEVDPSGEIIRFPSLAEDGSDVTTHHVRVRANALLLPPRSDFNPATQQGTYFYAYRITISMDKTAPESAACKLRSRYWLISDGSGREEVSGPGVIGEYPLMRPGSEFVYCSCCPLTSPSGSMEGHFQFVVLATGDLINVEVGRFALVS